MMARCPVSGSSSSGTVFAVLWYLFRSSSVNLFLEFDTSLKGLVLSLEEKFVIWISFSMVVPVDVNFVSVGVPSRGRNRTVKKLLHFADIFVYTGTSDPVSRSLRYVVRHWITGGVDVFVIDLMG